MKPLTIEELKALQMGEYVYIISKEYNFEIYRRKSTNDNENYFIDCDYCKELGYSYADYGTKWVAYKNKEQVEGNKDKEIKFYYDDNNDGINLSKYVFCIRPCDDNMSLKAFMQNGEICGYASEGYDTWVEGTKPIKEISYFEFMYDYVRPMLKRIYELKGE